MSDSLSDVCSCLRALDSSKATERKSNASRLEELLKNSTVIEILDTNTSAGGRSKVLTWDVILKGVIQYVDLETSVLQGAKESQSATTLANRTKKKQELAGLFKFVVRTANERGPQLNLDLILKCVEAVLCDEYMLECYGVDYSILFRKHVLRVRHYWLQLTAKQLKKFLVIFCELYEEARLDKEVAVKIIRDLLHGNALQGGSTGFPRKMFGFFNRVFSEFRELRAASIIENLLAAFNIFCKAVASTSRVKLCQFAELHLNGLMYLWENASTEMTKEELVSILHLLLVVHHPAGVTDPAVGAYAENWTVWRGHLESLHKLVVEDIDLTGGRFKFSSSSKVSILRPNYICLAADVFKQRPLSIPNHSDASLPLTQANTQVDGHGFESLPAKRQKLSVESKTLLELVKESSNTLQAIPWLQILSKLLEKYPSCFNKQSLINILSTLSSLLRDCKKAKLFEYIFSCLSVLCSQTDQWKGQEAKTLWLSVWSTCISTISSRHAETEGYQEHGFHLMACMLLRRLVIPGRDIWNLFLPDFSHPNPASDQLLTALVCSQGLHENHKPTILKSLSSEQVTQSFPLRKLLVDWLLSGMLSFETSAKSTPELSPHRTGEILYALTLQDPTLVLEKFQVLDRKLKLSDLEEILLKISLDFSEVDSRESTLDSTARRGDGVKGSDLSNPHILEVMEYGLDLLRHCISSVSETAEVSIKVVESGAWCSSGLLSLLQLSGSQHPSSARLKTMFKRSMETFAAHFVGQVNLAGHAGLLPSLITLGQALDSCFGDHPAVSKAERAKEFWLADFLRSCLPARFLDLLLEMAQGNKFESRRKSTASTSQGPRNRYDRSHRSFDSLQTGAAGRGRLISADSWITESHDLDPMEQGFDNNSNLQEVPDTHGDSGSSHQFLNEAGLVESQRIQLTCVELLCKLTAWDPRKATDSEDAQSNAEMDVDFVKGQLLEFLGPDKYKPNLALHVFILLKISKNLLSSNHHITESDIKTILSAFQKTAKELSEDQQACCEILSHMSNIIPHLIGDSGDDAATEELKYCRDTFFKFLTGFTTLASEGTARLKLEVVKRLHELLKHDPSCSWGTLKVTKEEEEEEGEGGGMGFELKTVTQQFPNYLKETDVSVSLFVAEHLRLLFMKEDANGVERQKDAKTQNRAFDSIFLICNDFLDEEHQNNPRGLDRLHVHQAVCVHSLSTIIASSPVCEKQCVLALCQTVSKQCLKLSLAQKALQQVSARLGYPDLQSYLQCHLPYLIHNWLNEGMVNSPISEFPYQLLGYDSLEQLVRSNQDLVVAEVLITRLNLSEVEDVLTLVQVDLHSGLLSALPNILTHVMPMFALGLPQQEGAAQSPRHTATVIKQTQRAVQCNTLLNSTVSEQEISDCVVRRLPDIVVHLLRCLHVNKTLATKETESLVYAEPNPPYYNQELLELTLNNLAKDFTNTKKASSIISLLTDVQEGLHQVLLSLATQIWRERRSHEQLRYFHMYSFFVRMLLAELSTGLQGGWAALLRDIFTRLNIILSRLSQKSPQVQSPSFEEELVLSAISLLQSVCKISMKVGAEEAANYIQQTVDTAATAACLSPAVGQAAESLLKQVLNSSSVKKFPVLQNALSILNPLPADVPQLASLQKTMENVCGEGQMPLVLRLTNLLKCFLKQGSLPSRGLALRLDQLTSHMTLHQEEVRSLGTTDSGLIVLRKVVSELVRLVSSSSQWMATAASSCLGAIGPVNLMTLTFPPRRSETSYYLAMETFRDEESEKYCWLLHSLDDYLQDESLDIVKTAGEILTEIFMLPSCATFEKKYKSSLGDSSFLFHYLHPFRSTKKKSMAPPAAPVKTEVLEQAMSRDVWLGLSQEDMGVTHEEWIRTLTTHLTACVQDEMLQKIAPMCQLKTEFCEESLPYLVHNILQSQNESLRQALSANISEFFHQHCIGKQQDSTPSAAVSNPPITSNLKSVKTMLRVVQYLRKQKRPQQRGEASLTPWHNNFWLDLDYLEVARAAQNCKAHFSAVLFTEIWWDASRQSSLTSSPMSDSQNMTSTLDPISQASSQNEKGQAMQQLLQEAYWAIGDPDAVYGCGAGRTADPGVRVQTYLHELQLEKALNTLDMAVTDTPSTGCTPLLQTLINCGMTFTLQRCLDGIQGSGDSTGLFQQLSPLDADALEEFRFQAAWQLAQWDTSVTAKDASKPGYHQSVFRALGSLRGGYVDSALDAVQTARLRIVHDFDSEVESCQTLYPVLSQLQCLTHLEQFVKIQGDANLSLIQLCNDNGVDDDLMTFKYREPLLHVVSSLGQVCRHSGNREGIVLETRALYNLAVGARQIGKFQLSEKALAELKTKVNSTSELSLERLKLEEAKLFWARSEVNIAINILKNLVQSLDKSSSPRNGTLYPEALQLYGSWLAETKSETPSVIITDYLQKTVDLMLDMTEGPSNSEDCTKTALEAFVSLGRFADEQYQLVADYMKSPMYEAKRDILRRSKTELDMCQEFKESSKYLKVVEKSSAIDEEELASLEEDYDRFLHQALENYLRCLKMGDTHDIKVFRIIALWFDNCKQLKVNRLIQRYVEGISTHKLLPLYYQLAARMSSKTSEDESNFQPVLNQVLESVARDHPHHALWVIMALAHAYKDEELLQGSSSKSKRRHSTERVAEEDRVQGAKDFLEKLKSENSVLKDIVVNMELLSVSYIQLANWTMENVNKNDKKPQALPKKLMLVKLPKLENVLVPSLELKVDPSGKYNNLVYPVKFAPTFRLAGGVNLPKIIKCQGSDGVERTQLVKGRDDLRQDAVMQQVFALVNKLLIENPETRQRQLKVRTYKVVPLSQKCGLLEWCEGTQPVGEYLTGSSDVKGAHVRYRPKDWLFKDCRLHLNSAGSNADRRFKAYQEICVHFKPVFRHFLMEKFPEPSVWFERRLAYTHSVATNSIVGHIIGLGDRHLMNILIDLKTAELVHIDLGIAFEQGRILPTPETVPFRLTRDIVDGMGITGVEGVFRRCCEKTMQVMRANSEALVTIVQVLLYDPLSHWTLTPQQAMAIQRKREQVNLDTMDLTSSGTVPASGQLPTQAGPSSGGKEDSAEEQQNKLAERTLLRLRQKLSGQEEGVPLSVSGQVTYLIQKASDPRNLCKLFAGWQPYL